MNEIITSIVSFVAFLMHAITGFGGNIMVFPVLSILYGTFTARICLNLIAWVSSISVTADSHKDINFKEYRYILIWMSLGMILGYLMIPYITSEKLILLVYGIIIVAIALYKLVAKREIEFGRTALVVILLLAGIIQAIFVSGGAFLVIYCAQTLKDKKEFRATFTAIWLSIYTVMFFVQLFKYGYTKQQLIIFAFGAIPVVIASILGSRIVNFINQKLFMRIVYFFILVVGTSLVFNNVG